MTKPPSSWVRAVVTGWVVVVVPLLLFSSLMAILTLPRILATAADSLGDQVTAVGDASGRGRWVEAGAGVLATGALLLPVAGTVYIVVRLGRRLAASAWRVSDRWRGGRPVLVTALVGLAAAIAWLWWPNGEYEPIRPGERGTLADAVHVVSDLPSGRPALSEQREAELDADASGPTSGSDEPEGPRERYAPREEEQVPTTSVPGTLSVPGTSSAPVVTDGSDDPAVPGESPDTTAHDGPDTTTTGTSTTVSTSTTDDVESGDTATVTTASP